MGWIFCFFFNAQRKHGGKFKYLDRYCDYFSSFVKIRDYITTERKGKMILMAPFLFFLPFSALVFLPPPTWDTARYWHQPYEHGSGFAVGGSSPLWGTREEGAAQHLASVIVPWFGSTPHPGQGTREPRAVPIGPASNPSSPAEAPS